MGACLFLSPGYPAEMPFFVRGLAEQGVRVAGIGDQPVGALPPMASHALAHYLQVGNLWDEAATVEAVRRWAPTIGGIDRVEVLWEPGMLLAARLREALGVPGMTVAQTVPFRDKESMKQVLDAAGVRTPHHRRATSEAEVRAAAEQLGYPLIIKPIAGAGSADTYRLENRAELEAALPKVRHVKEMSVEEFIEGEEFTFDTVCSKGRILFHNCAWYRPKPLVARSNEWISPQTIALKDLTVPPLQPGIELGRRVIQALGFTDGFTHMEWFLTPRGEAVFGEIGGRPPGARSVDIMNYACDADLFRAWAEATTHGRISQRIERHYNAAHVCKRAQGQGIIRRIEGLERIRRDFGPWLVHEELLPVGTHRRDWKQTLLSDGFLIVRHPQLSTLIEMADRLGTEVQLYAS
ncbi:MAG: ATP-grasp domain-containing protein [Planctomycetia bacterium]|nr:ATP-grasp domain-containing protein [Planctomycetia bacterium]